MAVEDEVRQASDSFYAALNQLLKGNPSSMSEVWSHGGDVSTMHPIGGREIGWDQVWQTWQQTSQGLAQVDLSDVTVPDLVVIPVGSDAAYTLGTEQIRGNVGGQEVSGGARATNVYRREGGQWKMVHHHGDALPQELIQAMMSQG
jgi:ketosteroid isomerase-like protein